MVRITSLPISCVEPELSPSNSSFLNANKYSTTWYFCELILLILSKHIYFNISFSEWPASNFSIYLNISVSKHLLNQQLNTTLTYQLSFVWRLACVAAGVCSSSCCRICRLRCCISESSARPSRCALTSAWSHAMALEESTNSRATYGGARGLAPGDHYPKWLGSWDHGWVVTHGNLR